MQCCEMSGAPAPVSDRLSIVEFVSESSKDLSFLTQAI